MAQTKTKAKEKDLLTKLADKGDEAINRLSELPGGTRALNAFNDLRARVDDLSRKVRGIEELEVRVAKLEKEVAALKKPKTRSTTRSSSSS